MKKYWFFKKLGLLFLGAALVVPLNAWAQSGQNVVMNSEVGDVVYGPISPGIDDAGNPDPEWEVPPPGDATDWGGQSKLAVEVTELDPGLFSQNGAQWISTAAVPEDDGAVVSYRWFRDAVTAPCTASDKTSGIAYVDSYDEAQVFVNGTPLGIAMSGSAQYAVDIEPGETKTFDFVVKDTTETDTTGVIYTVEAEYDLPTVLWRPPITTSANTSLKNGRTLPIKFKLTRDGIALKERQDVYVTVSDSQGNTQATFNPGVGARNMRFARGGGQYIVNFKTKDFALVVGETYTVNVHDGCSGDVLGSKELQVVGKKKPERKVRKVKEQSE